MSQNMDLENHSPYLLNEKCSLAMLSDEDCSNKENDTNYNIIKDSKKELDATYELDTSEYDMSLRLPCTPLTSPNVTESASLDLPKRSTDHEIYFDSINFTRETYLHNVAQLDNVQNVSPLNNAKIEKTSPLNVNTDNDATKNEFHELESTFMRGLKNVINLFRHSPKNIEKSTHNLCADSVQESFHLSDNIIEIHDSDNAQKSPDYSSTPILSQTKVKRVTDHSGFDKTKNSKTMFTESFINELCWDDDSTVIFNTDKLNNVLSMDLPTTVESKNNVNFSTIIPNHPIDGPVLHQSEDIQITQPKYYFPQESMKCDVKQIIEDLGESFISSQTSEKESLSYNHPVKIEKAQILNTSNKTHIEEVVFLPDKFKDESFSSNAMSTPSESLEKITVQYNSNKSHTDILIQNTSVDKSFNSTVSIQSLKEEETEKYINSSISLVSEHGIGFSSNDMANKENHTTITIENTEDDPNSKMDLKGFYLSSNNEDKTSPILQSSIEIENNTLISLSNKNDIIPSFSENIQTVERDTETSDTNIALKASQITHETRKNVYTTNKSELEVIKLAGSNIKNNTNSSFCIDNNCTVSCKVDELNNCCNSSFTKSVELDKEGNSSLQNQLFTPFDIFNLEKNVTNEIQNNHTNVIGKVVDINVHELNFSIPNNEAVSLNNFDVNLTLDQHQDTCNFTNSDVLDIFADDIGLKDSLINNDADESYTFCGIKSMTDEDHNRNLQNKLSNSTSTSTTFNEIPHKSTNIIGKILDIKVIKYDNPDINNSGILSNCGVNISRDQNKQGTCDVTNNDMPVIILNDNLKEISITNKGASFLGDNTDDLSPNEYKQDTCAVTNIDIPVILRDDDLLEFTFTNNEVVSNVNICAEQDNQVACNATNNDSPVTETAGKENIETIYIFGQNDKINDLDLKDSVEIVNGIYKNQIFAETNICKSEYTNGTTEAFHSDIAVSDKFINLSEMSKDANVNVQNLNQTMITDDNLFSGEKFISGECFNDSKAFDFLMGCSNNLMIGAKDSLFLKFDPLYAALSPKQDSQSNNTNKDLYNLSGSEESYENRSIDSDLQVMNIDMINDNTTETRKHANDDEIIFTKKQDDKEQDVNNTTCFEDDCDLSGNTPIRIDDFKNKQLDSQTGLNNDNFMPNITCFVTENNNKYVNECQVVNNDNTIFQILNSQLDECLPEFKLTNKTSINNNLIGNLPKSPKLNHASNLKQNFDCKIASNKAINIKPECLQTKKDDIAYINESDTKSNTPEQISHTKPKNTKSETISTRLDIIDPTTCEYNNILIPSQCVSLENKQLTVKCDADNSEKSKLDLFILEKTDSINSKSSQSEANFTNKSTDMDSKIHKSLMIDVAVLNENVNELSIKSNKNIDDYDLCMPTDYTRNSSDIEGALEKEKPFKKHITISDFQSTHLTKDIKRDSKADDIVLKHKQNNSFETDVQKSEHITGVNKQLESPITGIETIQQFDNLIEEVSYPNTTLPQNCSIESSQTINMNSLLECQKLQYQDCTAIENIVKPNINSKVSFIDKPILAVSPAVNSSSFTADEIFITRDNNFVSPAITAINRIISFGSNSLNYECHPNDNLKNQIEVFEKESLRKVEELAKLKEENVILEINLRERNKSIETLTKEKVEKLNQLSNYGKNIDKNVKSINGMKHVVLEYEQTMSKLISERENDRKKYLEERKIILQDRDEQTSHLSSMERTFNDLHAKFEKCKVIILEYKEKEDILTEIGEKNIDKLNKMQETYDQLKHHATKSLQLANSKLSKENKVHEAEVIKIKAILKRKEMIISSIEEELARVTRNNAELTAFCDDLITKVG